MKKKIIIRIPVFPSFEMTAMFYAAVLVLGTHLYASIF